MGVGRRAIKRALRGEGADGRGALLAAMRLTGGEGMPSGIADARDEDGATWQALPSLTSCRRSVV